VDQLYGRRQQLPDVVDDGIEGSEGDDGSDVLDDDDALFVPPPPSARFAGALVPQTLQ